MFSRELAENLRPVLLRLSIAVFFPVIVLLTRGRSILITGDSSAVTPWIYLYIGILIGGAWASSFLGVNAFRAEFRDQAWDYLFAAPRPDWRTWLDKVAARLTLLLLPALLALVVVWVIGQLEPGMPQAMTGRSPLADCRWVFPRLALLLGLGFLLSPFDWGSFRPALPFLLPLALSVWDLLRVQLVRRAGLPAWQQEPLAYLPAAALLFLFLLRWPVLRRGAPLRLGQMPFRRRRSGQVQAASPGLPPRRWGLPMVELDRLWRGEAISLALLVGAVSLLRWMDLVPTARSWAVGTALLGLMILIRAFANGYNLFQREFNDRALEYLLTVPASFLRLTAEKATARVLAQVPTVLAFLALSLAQGWRIAPILGSFAVLLDPRFFPFWYLLLFFTGAFMSPFAARNLHALVSLATFFALVVPTIAASRLVVLPAGAGLDSWSSFLWTAGGMLPAVGVLGAAFFSVARRFHLATGDRYLRVYGLRTLLPLTVLTLAGGTILILG